MRNTAPHVARRRGRRTDRQTAVVEAVEARQLFAATLADFYTSGKGAGLNFQTLTGYEVATTYGTTIAGSTANSALDDSVGATGQSPVRPGFAFGPENLVGFDPVRGGAFPWTSQTGPAAPAGVDREYIKFNVPDSANTATTIYSGVKSYNGALGVDVFEQAVPSILERAAAAGKSTGAVSSVPLTHATPAATYAHVNRRHKYDGPFPELDNILQQGLRNTKPTVLLGGGHPLSGPGYSYVTPQTYAALKDPTDPYGYGYRFIERGPDAAAKLSSASASVDPNAGGRLIGLYGARGQDGNLPWSTADGDYANAGLQNRLDTVRPLDPGETDAAFVARERDENPTLADLSSAALNVLGKDQDGFFVMIEGGDIDFAAHDNAIDNMIGKVLEFDAAVGRVQAWIEANGGYEKNLLLVTADHDHYLTLKDDFPAQLAARGAAALQADPDAATAGHFWGSDPAVKYGWATHSNRPVPVYYQGPAAVAAALDAKTGTGFNAYGVAVPGVAGLVDQSHLFQTMDFALSSPQSTAKNVIIMIGDGMGWEMARAGAIQKRLDAPKAALSGGTLTITGSNNGDELFAQKSGSTVKVVANGRTLGSYAYASIASIVVDARGGDDYVSLGDTIVKPSLVLGGDGDDRLFSTGGRSIVVGGEGTDRLSGRGQDDVLVGGASKLGIASLKSLLTKWTSGQTYAQRVTAVRPTFGPSLVNDGFADRLTGANGRDWYFQSSGDVLIGRVANETVN